MKGFKDSSGKFHPITQYKKGVRKSRVQKLKIKGIVLQSPRIRRSREIKDEELIIHTKRKPKRSDAFFYPDGDSIAEINYKGWKIYAYPDGDIRVTDKKTGEEIRNNNAPEHWNEFTDRLINSDRFEWDNNNWFEISARNPDKRFVDLTMAEYEYGSAIQRLKDVLDTLKKQGTLQ